MIDQRDLPEGQQRSYRRVEIEVGYGIEKILPKARIRSIIEQEIVPYFQQGDFSGGTLEGTKALISVLEADKDTSIRGKLAVFYRYTNQILASELIKTLIAISSLWILLKILDQLWTIFKKKFPQSSSKTTSSSSGDTYYSDSGGSSWGGGDFGGGDSGGGGDGGGW